MPYFRCTGYLKQRRIAELPVFRKCVAPSLSSYNLPLQYADLTVIAQG